MTDVKRLGLGCMGMNMGNRERPVELTAEDIERIEAALPADRLAGAGMRNFTFRDGRVVGA